MAESVATAKTSLSPEEAVERAVMFFPGEKWRARTHMAKTATFEGKPPIPWFMILLTIIGLITFVIPGIILYIVVVRRMYRLQNLVVSSTAASRGSDVTVRYPKQAKKLVMTYIEALPA